MLERSFGRREVFSSFFGGRRDDERDVGGTYLSMEFFSLSAGRMICCY